MKKTRPWRRLATTAIVGGGMFLAGALLAAPQLVQREVLVLDVKVLTATRIGDLSRPVTLTVDPAKGGESAFDVEWPGPGDQTSVTLRAREVSRARDLRQVTIEAELVLPDGSKVRSDRRFDIREGTTSLFEVFRLDERPLTLAVEGRLSTQSVVPGMPSIGRPVGLSLEIQHIREGASFALESNSLHTFVGEPVTYRFDLGVGEDAPSVRLTLTPTRITGDLVEIDVELSGALPGEVTQWVSRHEQWISSRGAPSSIGLESGDPPSGYRFVVTPVF